MPQFMIELAHEPDECIKSLKELEPEAPDLLDGTFWGCISGRHAGWVIVNALNEDEALNMVPTNLRGKATVTEVDAIAGLGETIDPEAAHPADAAPDAS